MKSIEIASYAKINLSIDVTGVDCSDFHTMDMIRIEPSLCRAAPHSLDCKAREARQQGIAKGMRLATRWVNSPAGPPDAQPRRIARC